MTSTIKYFLNDPTTIELCEDQTIPETSNFLPFFVQGFHPDKLNDSESAQSVNCYISICRSLNNFQKIISEIDKPLKQWAYKRPLKILPNFGNNFNAFYSRDSINFCSAIDRRTKKMIYAAESVDVVSHELGHGILDALRPELWNTQCLEIWAFHEAFGDINAMMTVMQSDIVINHILEETNGDLTKSNVLSRIGEELGIAVQNMSIKNNKIHCLRDATIKIKYTRPELLPQRSVNGELCAECHNFGRIFSSAWYEIFVEFFNQNKLVTDDISALKMAGNQAYSYLIKGIKLVPVTLRFTEALSKSMLFVSNEQHKEIMSNVFKCRNIIRPIVKMLSNLSLEDVQKNMTNHDKVIKLDDSILIHKKQNRKFKISDHLVSNLSADHNVIFDNNIVVPTDNYYQFDKSGNLVDEITVSHDEILQSSISCVSSIEEIGIEKMWNVKNKNLLRNYICCKSTRIPFSSK